MTLTVYESLTNVKIICGTYTIFQKMNYIPYALIMA